MYIESLIILTTCKVIVTNKFWVLYCIVVDQMLTTISQLTKENNNKKLYIILLNVTKQEKRAQFNLWAIRFLLITKLLSDHGGHSLLNLSFSESPHVTLSIMDFDNVPVNAFIRLIFFLAYRANQLDIKTSAGMGIHTGLILG